MLHGWGGTYERTWSGSVLERALRAACRTVAGLDLPGRGQGPVSHEPKEYELLAGQLAAALPHGVLARGKAPSAVAADYPERFRRL